MENAVLTGTRLRNVVVAVAAAVALSLLASPTVQAAEVANTHSPGKRTRRSRSRRKFPHRNGNHQDTCRQGAIAGHM